mmetsp:Transcript_28423/g.62950  ORF Transcript_28423/g.62950 Transcript_28423/m.62950 type:complete len:129 (-) Transcript_28423:384-770(-)
MTNISICFILIALLFVQISVAYAFAEPRLSGLSRDRHTLWMGALNEPPLELCEENAEIVIEEVRQELGTIFGYDQGSRDVGITGKWIDSSLGSQVSRHTCATNLRFLLGWSSMPEKVQILFLGRATAS